MEVAAGNANKSELSGQCTKSLAFPVREAGAVDLDGAQTLIGKRLKLRLPEIMGRMRQRGHAAGSLDQGDRPLTVEPRFINASGASVSQKPREDLARTGDLAGSRQVVGQMTPSQDARGKTRRTASRSIESPSIRRRSTMASNRRARPVRSDAMASQKRRVVVADEIPQDVNLAIIIAGQVSSTPVINSMPHRAASGRATARAETVSWSVIASAARPTLAAATTTSHGEQTPSECVVWTCRSARSRLCRRRCCCNHRVRLYAGFASSGCGSIRRR